MRAVGIRELKNRLSEYLRQVRRGEEILVTDRGEVVAELRPPTGVVADAPYPALLTQASRGRVRLGAGGNRPDLYPALEPLMSDEEIQELLQAERGER